jgi:hypothetical protein
MSSQVGVLAVSQLSALDAMEEKRGMLGVIKNKLFLSVAVLDPIKHHIFAFSLNY